MLSITHSKESMTPNILKITVNLHDFFFYYSGKALFLEMWVMPLYYWDCARAQLFHFSVCIESDCPCKGLVQNVT